MALFTIGANGTLFTVSPEERGYYELSLAIIQSAVVDYKKAKMTVINDGENSRAEYECDTLLTFFNSPEFERMTGVEDTNDFVRKLDKDIEDELNKRKARKRVKKIRQY